MTVEKRNNIESKLINLELDVLLNLGYKLINKVAIALRDNILRMDELCNDDTKNEYKKVLIELSDSIHNIPTYLNAYRENIDLGEHEKNFRESLRFEICLSIIALENNYNYKSNFNKYKDNYIFNLENTINEIINYKN